MTQLEQYRWEDRVLRKGNWKFNLAVGAVAFGVLTGACLDSRGGPWTALSVSPQPDGTTVVRGVIPKYLEGSVDAYWLMNSQRLAM